MDNANAALYSGTATTSIGKNFLSIPITTSGENQRIEIRNASSSTRFILDNILLSAYGIAGVSYYTAQLVSAKDYYPFGTTLPSRTFQGDRFSGYSYRFNGQEGDSETYGDGNALDFGARIYDARLGRWLSVDPSQAKYPHLSPYNAFENNPVFFNDPDGKDAGVTVNVPSKTVIVSTTIYVYGSGATKAAASQMQADIMGAWNTGATYTDKNGQVYNVKFAVKVEIYNPSDPSESPGLFSGKNNPWNTDNYVQLNNDDKRSFVSGGDEGEWRTKGRGGSTLAADDPAPHEFGHLLGLADRYIESGGVQAGWGGNIMAEPAMMGKVEQKNIDAIMENVFTSDFYNFQADYNSRVDANKGNYSASQLLGVPYIHNTVNPTYETKIDNSSVNWECTDETECH